MMTALRNLGSGFKTFFFLFPLMVLAGCSTNPATGQQQFTALMSPQQESQVGADEHAKVMKTYGTVGNEALEIYVTKVGKRVAANTERADVQYKFFVLDDPMVNAFALPGGYVYVTRGLLAQANSEAELAAVLGHEVGHITGRHSAERYSRGVVTSLGAMVLSAALDSPTASQALGVGSDLFLKSYSRGQEHEADTLGIRYIANAGYNPDSMTNFLMALNANTNLENQISGKGGSGPAWFSTHPLTSDRIQQTIAQAGGYPQKGEVERGAYLAQIDGLVYGESEKQGFVRGTNFYHTKMDFTFSVPDGFKMINQPTQVAAVDESSGAVIVFDTASAGQAVGPLDYVTQLWMKGEQLSDTGNIEVNGKRAATASFPGTVNNRAVTIRIVAVEWTPGVFFRFQIAIPNGASAALLDGLKRTTYSLRPMTAAEKRDVKPYRLRVVTAKAGDTVASLAHNMPFDDYREQRFRVLNTLAPNAQITAGRQYKVVSAR